MKKTVLATAMLFGVAFATAGVANADPRPTAVASPGSSASVDAVWHYHSTWANENACRSTGKNLVAQGAVRAYTCEFHDHPQIPTWSLYVLD